MGPIIYEALCCPLIGALKTKLSSPTSFQSVWHFLIPMLKFLTLCPKHNASFKVIKLTLVEPNFNTENVYL